MLCLLLVAYLGLFAYLHKHRLRKHRIKSVDKLKRAMEDIFWKFHIFWKFPHLIEGIFSKLRNEDLAKSNEVSRIWNLHLEQERFFQIRMIENQIEKYVLVEDGQIAIKHWERFFKTATTETLNELRYAMKFRSYNFFYKNLFGIPVLVELHYL